MSKLFCLLIVCCTSIVMASNWPQYLGPNRDCTSTESGLARSWPTNGPPVAWSVKVGAGFGGAAIADQEVYILDRAGKTQDVMRCFALKTGQEIWKHSYDAPGVTSYPGSRSVPTIDKNLIFSCGPFGDLYCFNRKTHKVVWHKNVWKVFEGETLPRWAISQSPLIYKNLVIIAPQTPKCGLVAFDKKTGKIIWKTKSLAGIPSYTSPKLVKINNEDQIAMISGDGSSRNRGRRRGPKPSDDSPKKNDPPVEKAGVWGLSPKDGEILWHYAGWQSKIPVPNITALGSNKFFVTSGYNAGAACFQVIKKDKSYQVKEIFKTAEFGTHVHPAVLYQGNLYACCSDNQRKDGLASISVDGKINWKTKKKPFFDKGGMIIADNLMFCVDGIKGILYLVEPNPKAFKKISEARILNTSQCWAPLALSDGKLVIRDQKEMKCVDVSSK